MTSLIVQWLVTSLAILAAAYVLPGMKVKNYGVAMIAAVVMGIANALIRPVVSFLAFPVTILTLGLFALVINGFMLWLVAKIVPDFEVDGCLTAILGAVLVSVISALTMWILPFG